MSDGQGLRVLSKPPGPQRVLLAEDDPQMRALLVDSLVREGFEVSALDTVRTLEEELIQSVLGQERPSVIVTDRMMPGGDGLDVIAAARARGWSIPVVLVTAFADHEVHRRARALGGCVVLSKPVELESVSAAVRALATRGEIPIGPASSETGATVLVAEDDDDLRALMAGAIRLDGHTVLEASDGLALANLLDATTLEGEPLPDLVVTDVTMPGMSGLRVLAGMRRNGWTVPVVIVTGYGDQVVQSVSEALEVAAVLHKPVEMDELRAVVTWVLREAEIRRLGNS